MKYKCKVCGGTADKLKICCDEEMTPVTESSEKGEGEEGSPRR